MNTIDQAAYEGDIVSRLRNWRGLHLAHGGDLFEEAAGEIERLREQLAKAGEKWIVAEMKARCATAKGRDMSDIIERIKGLRYVHVPQASQLFEEVIAEIERLRLTDAERRAVEFAWCSVGRDDGFNERDAEEIRETLEQLLERTK